MAKIELHFTCDHELFGNGSGDVECCMIRPAEEMMGIFEQFGATITFFFDVCEYWAMKEVQERGGFEGEAKPADLLESHLKDIIKRGHDVQLHFHPQWLHYGYKGAGQWELDYRMWRLPAVEQYWEGGGEDALEELFKRGKATLEGLLQAEDPNYRCVGFRAGAWGIQPEEKVLEAMRKQGFEWDSTVVPGKKLEEDLTKFDFREASAKAPFWKIRKNVCQPDEEGSITEYPIYTVPISGWKNGQLTLLKLRKKVPLKPAGCEGTAISGSKKEGPFGKLRKLREAFRPGHRMFNFTDGATFEEMKFMAEKALQEFRDWEGTVPVVVIGHSKTFGNGGELKGFLDWMESRKASSIQVKTK